MDSIFLTRVLMGVINKLKPAPTLILDTVFATKKRSLSSLFSWDILTSSERILKSIKVSSPASMADTQGGTRISCDAPRFAEKRLITAGEMTSMRAFGTTAGMELLQEKVGENLKDIRRKIDITREFMAAKALSGQIIDESGSVLVDFNFAAAQKPTLTGTALWTDAASDPVANIRAWQKQVGQALGNVQKWVAFCGTDAMDALLNNQNVRELLKYTQGNDVAEKGRIANLAGVEIIEYFGSYIDENGARQDLIPVDRFITVAITGDQAMEIYAPVVDFDSESGVGMGKPGEVFFAKAWDSKDPSGKWLKGESRPLPVLTRPEAVVYAKVV